MKTLPEILSTLKSLKPELSERYRVETMGVFGSYCRGEQTQKSDIDILVTFKQEAHPGFFAFLELEEFLAKQLGAKVDLVSKNALKPHIGKYILEEVIMV